MEVEPYLEDYEYQMNNLNEISGLNGYYYSTKSTQ